MKHRGTAETPIATAARRKQHEDYLAAGWTMVLGINGKMHRRMVRNTQRSQG